MPTADAELRTIVLTNCRGPRSRLRVSISLRSAREGVRCTPRIGCLYREKQYATLIMTTNEERRSTRPEPRRREIRERLSDKINAATYEFLRANRLWVKADAYRINLSLIFRRFQLAYVEPKFAQLLRKKKLHGEYEVDIDVQALRAPDPRGLLTRLRRLRRQWMEGIRLARLGWKSRSSAPRFLGSATRIALAKLRGKLHGARKWARKVMNRLILIAMMFRSRTLDVHRIGRVYFIDAEELKQANIGGKRYIYHKYLEGIVDFNLMNVPADSCVMLYGHLNEANARCLSHRRVGILQAYGKPGDRDIGEVLDGALWTTFFEDRDLTSMLGPLDKPTAQYVMREVSRDEVAIVTAALRFVSRFSAPVDIYLDRYDSSLFGVSQALAENFPQHRVIGMQRVLGPYTFSLNIKGAEGLIRQPDKMLVWSKFHEQCLRRLGYECDLERIGMFKLKTYAGFKQLDRGDIRRRLGIPEARPVIMFSAVQRIIDYTLIGRWKFVEMIQDLAELTHRSQAFVLFKPWPGEEVGFIASIVSPLMRDNYMLVDDKVTEAFHNVELLNASDFLVSTMSSFIGEAFFFDVMPVLVNTRAAETYFSREYTREFRRFCLVKDEQVRLREVLRPLLPLRAEQRREFFERGRSAFVHMFGEVK